MRFLFLVCALLTLGASFARAQDDEIEEKWHQTYSKYYNKSLTDEEWSQIAGDKVGETYKIQKGDTLWGISITLFGTGFYWPKIWQLNSDITNPHNIKSNYEIHFVPGSTEAAPQVNVVEKTKAAPKAIQVKSASGSVDINAAEYTSAPVIPPPSIHSRPVIMHIPPSLPMLVARKQETNYDRYGFSLETGTYSPEPEQLLLASYVSKDEPHADGEVVEAEEDQSQASMFQYLYVKLDKGAVGKTYTAYSVGKKLVDPTGETPTSGHPIYYQGEIEVTELVNAKKNIYKALVKKSIMPVEVGASVNESRMEIVNLSPTTEFAKVNGLVIGGEIESSRYNFGIFNIVYFNVGTDQGLKAGQMIRILKNERLRKDVGVTSLVKEERRPIAVAKIVKVTAQYATGVVLSIDREIKVGDFAGDMELIKAAGGVDKNEIDGEVTKEAKALESESGGRPDTIPDTNPDTELNDDDVLE